MKMTMTDPNPADLGTTTWRAATHGWTWIQDTFSSDPLSTWADTDESTAVDRTRDELLGYTKDRLTRLLNAGVCSPPAALAALRATAAVVVDGSATPQPSATQDSGVLIEWLVDRASLHMRLDATGELIETWAMHANGSFVLDEEGPARQFGTSPARLAAKAFLTEISSGVVNRVPVDA